MSDQVCHSRTGFSQFSEKWNWL